MPHSRSRISSFQKFPAGTPESGAPVLIRCLIYFTIYIQACSLRIPFFGSAPKQILHTFFDFQQAKFSLRSADFLRSIAHLDSTRFLKVLEHSACSSSIEETCPPRQLTGWRSFFWEGVPYNMKKWLSNLTRRVACVADFHSTFNTLRYTLTSLTCVFPLEKRWGMAKCLDAMDVQKLLHELCIDGAPRHHEEDTGKSWKIAILVFRISSKHGKHYNTICIYIYI